MTFRWYGDTDSIKIEYIKQIPNMYGIVSAVYDTKVGQVWSRESIDKIKRSANSVGLTFEVVESVPVHEDIKLGLASRDRYIDNYCDNIRRLAEVGVKCICYNFMPVFDWTRTQLDKVGQDGSSSLVYYDQQIKDINPANSDLSLPGWDASYNREDLQKLFSLYGKIDKEDLWNNLKYFLDRVIPVAEQCDVLMAIHPDDPPWDIFGLPRLITNEDNIDRFLQLYDSRYNGLTLCTGSLGCAKSNDVVKMVDKYSKQGKIHFMHIRNIKILENGFEETAHFSSCGSLDIEKIVKVLVTNNFDGYIRADHGRMIWGEVGKAGYGLYDRALGVAYLNGLIEALTKESSVL